MAGARWEGTRTTICSDEESDKETGKAAAPSQQKVMSRQSNYAVLCGFYVCCLSAYSAKALTDCSLILSALVCTSQVKT